MGRPTLWRELARSSPATQIEVVESSGRAWASSGVGAVGWAVLKEFIGWNDMVGCFSRGDLWACGSLILDAIPWTSVISKGKKILRAISAISSAISAWQKAQERARKIIAAAKAAWAAAEKAAAAAKAAAKRAAQAAKKRAAAAKAAATRAAKRQQKNTGNAVQKTARSNVQKTAADKKSTTASKQSKGGGNGTSSREPDQGEPAACTVNSFVPGTKVLMADGTAKPIEDVDNGDTVQATDPETGDTTTQTVTAEIKGEGLKHLVRITIDTDGGKGTGTATVTATDGHPFWVPELHDWIDATDLTPGQWLRTSAGTHVQITAVKRRTTTSATVHNLTITNTHTYYVLAGATPVLVHNCGTTNGGKYGDLQPAGAGNEINHIPANASSPLSKYSGPSIRMDYADHRAVYSTGSSLASKAWRMRQKELIDAGDFRSAIQMDVDDIRARFGNKYDEAITEMWMSLSQNKALRKWATDRQNP